MDPGIPTSQPLEWLGAVPEPWRWWLPRIGAALLGLLVLRRAVGSILRMLRRRRPAVINPKLQKYNVDYAELLRRQRELAGQVIATSTSARLAGYRIVRQVDAVFVEGYRTPEEAMVALKAAAVERGANAILNVRTDRTASGRCTAAGDAVQAAVLPARPGKPPDPPPAG